MKHRSFLLAAGALLLGGMPLFAQPIYNPQGEERDVCKVWDGTDTANVTAAGALQCDGSGVTQPVSGTLTCNAGSGTLAVSGPLTDTQLRATPVPVSGTVTVTDGAGALNTIVDSGSLTCNAGTNLNTSALALDATLTNRLPAGSTPADNESNAITASRLGAFSFIFDGSTWDRWTGAVSQSGTWTVQPGNTANTTPWLSSIAEGGVTADVLDLTNNNPLTCAIVDGAGSQITSFGGGTQYTEGDTDATITGTAVMWEDAADTIRVASAAKPLPVTIISGPAGGDGKILDGTAAGQADVMASAPAGTEEGLVTRNIPSGTQPISGTVTANAGSGTFVVGDGAGALNVIVDSSALPSGASTLAEQQTQTTSLQKIDNIAHAGSDVALSEHVPISGQLDDAATTAVTENQVAPVRITSGRALHVAQQGTVTVSATDLDIRNLTATDTVTVTDGAGALNVIVDSGTTAVTQATAANLNAEVQGEAADGAAVSGNPVLIAGQDGTNAQSIKTDTTGSVQVDIESAPTLTVSDGAGAMNVVVDSITAGDTDIGNVDLEFAGAAASVNNGASDATTQRVTIANDSTGEIRVADDAGNQIPSSTATPALNARGLNVRLVAPDPCSNEKATPFAVDIVTATTVLVATGVGSEHVYICSVNLVTAGANNVALIAGTGATCGTSTAGINGGTTAAEGWNFAANGGIALPATGFAHMSTEVTGGATGDSVCIVTSAAVQLSGTITYVIQAP